MRYGKDYFGFIYLWMDYKRKRFYLGSHMGPVDSGYICSSSKMRKVYKRRPETFRRRIIYWHTTEDRQSLYDVETRWLSLIRDEELGKKYYNVVRVAKGFDPEYLKKHWADPEKRAKHIEGMKNSWPDVRREVHSAMLRKRWECPEYQAKLSVAQQNRTMSEEGLARKKQLASARQKGKKHDEATRQKMSDSAKARANTPEYKEAFKSRTEKLKRDEKGRLMKKGT
jgi:hypothetical protein